VTPAEAKSTSWSTFLQEKLGVDPMNAGALARAAEDVVISRLFAAKAVDDFSVNIHKRIVTDDAASPFLPRQLEGRCPQGSQNKENL
jgi:hypothetical protein